jgi:N-acetylneuraminate synthase
MDDVVRAVEATVKHNAQIALMQCNTNYTASLENFRYIQLNVLRSFSAMYPGMVLGLSDHTPGHATVLGAVALGATVIEKHFTDDQSRIGPDHRFSMSPVEWKEMVYRTRELELALGYGVKAIEGNEVDTVVIQRRATRAAKSLQAGHRIEALDFDFLRPCPENGVPPYLSGQLVGRVLRKNISKGDLISIFDVD